MDACGLTQGRVASHLRREFQQLPLRQPDGERQMKLSVPDPIPTIGVQLFC